MRLKKTHFHNQSITQLAVLVLEADPGDVPLLLLSFSAEMNSGKSNRYLGHASVPQEPSKIEFENALGT